MSYKQTQLFVYPDEIVGNQNLQPILDPFSLSMQLCIPNRHLWQVLIKTGQSPEQSKIYKRYRIPKPNGDTREIFEPSTSFPKSYSLKQILKSLTVLLFMNDKYPFVWPDHVDAYVPGKSQVDSAEKHAGNKTLIALDIKNFFPSCKIHMVRHAIRHEFGYCHDTAGIIAKLVTLQKKLPQGSPISPFMANLVGMHRFDIEILKKLSETNDGWVYSRYCDDLLLSHPDELDQNYINFMKEEIIRIVLLTGFEINKKKVRVYGKGNLQSHRWLGMTINEKPNYPKESYRKLRATLYNASVEGITARAEALGLHPEKYTMQLRGMLAYVKDKLEPGRYEKLESWFEIAQARDTVEADLETIFLPDSMREV